MSALLLSLLDGAPVLIGAASQALGCSVCTTRRMLDQLGDVARDSSGRRIVSPALLAQLIAMRAQRTAEASR